jgi:AraC family transcriptional regulator
MPDRSATAENPAGRVAVDFRDERPAPDERRLMKWHGVVADHLTVGGPQECDYRWVGTSDFLVLHDMRLVDGQVETDDGPAARLLDLRQRMTFIPKGCGVWGWSQFSRRTHAFTAIYFDAAMLADEMGRPDVASSPRPVVHFENAALLSTLQKIQALLSAPAQGDAAYGETLALLAAIELDWLRRVTRGPELPDPGRLTIPQERRVRDFIDANLDRDISLHALADLVGMPRLQFARSFRKTTGRPAFRFILGSRIERAMQMLVEGDLPVQQIAAHTGFRDPSRLATVFRQLAGCTPSEFRRLHR